MITSVGINSENADTHEPLALNSDTTPQFNAHAPKKSMEGISFSENTRLIQIQSALKKNNFTAIPSSNRDKDDYINTLSPMKASKEKSENEDSDSPCELYDAINSFKLLQISERELSYFLMSPLPKEKTLVCNIKLVYSKKSYPQFALRINSNNRLLLVAKKIFQATSSVYHICLKDDDDFSSQSGLYLGKVSSNFVGNEFNIFGKGKKHNQTKDVLEMRQQFGCVSYKLNILGINGLRKMKVYLPGVDSSGCINKHVPTSTAMYIKQVYEKSQKMGEILLFKNREPMWSPKCNAYLLNFNGRVQVGSPKNFQLIYDNECIKFGETILQFGKINDTTYAMDFQYPLSPFQAFAICLTSLARKLACE